MFILELTEGINTKILINVISKCIKALILFYLLNLKYTYYVVIF